MSFPGLLVILQLIFSVYFRYGDGQTITYPTVYRNESFVENLHEKQIADPYRWLENPDTPEYQTFITAENNLTNGFIQNYLHYGHLKAQVEKLYNFPQYGTPNIAGDHIYYTYNPGLLNQPAIYRQKYGLTTESGEMFFDPNKLSVDGTTALMETSWSKDGRFMGYMLSDGGSDWRTIKILVAETMKDLPETLTLVKFSSFAWTVDNKGFFYNRFPEVPASGGKATGSDYNQKLYYHRIGTPQSQDVLCGEFPANPSWQGAVSVSSDGNYIFMAISRSTESNNALWYADLRKAKDIQGILPWVQLITNFDAAYEVITNQGSLFYIRTNLNAPNYKVIVIDAEKPSEVRELFPETENYLSFIDCAAQDKLILHYMINVKSAMSVHDLSTGRLLYNFDLGLSTVTQTSGKKRNSQFFYKVQSFIDPGTIYVVDLSKDIFEPMIFREIRSTEFTPDQFETKQVFYPSKDGTRIPMFISHRKGLIPTEETPTLLYGYGGFHIAIQPSYGARYMSFMKFFDGIYAVANIRGGSEYGEGWWQGGSLNNKQNTFDDFQAAAEYLQKEKYTSARKLTIMGGSNGGLLIGACINQRPELFGAAIPMVGVMDMLRFHKFTIGHFWVSDYGNPDVKADFDVLFRYSPLHNIRKPNNTSVQYPATLVMTADRDDRVAPLHSMKYIAELQHTLKTQSNPLMIRVETKAGHGAGTSTSKSIVETTDWLSFCAKNLQYNWIA